eukprot:m.713015 g.713015  ORF g.713015 m.713015 type:complete len:147 (-) comp22967_c0_seq13:128-568(-)
MSHAPTNISWKAFLTPHGAGGNLSISASCKNCGNTSSVAMIHDLTFGDVFICSGQSNMWLPMQYALTRNRTFSLVDSGDAYGNIRVSNRYPVMTLDKYRMYMTEAAPSQFGKYWHGWFRYTLPDVYVDDIETSLLQSQCSRYKGLK